ncbi:hypothetical protein NDU88_003607 [Pleurodeles waltl]|uniref:Uncharacterized protein n=1 Tax=Pleurodeles waltl TaxID=8319 RepID=A0AAV7WTI5_PLEWA|nr:hypothetical protein NDU88_003607 [Pleurodeles waltl]
MGSPDADRKYPGDTLESVPTDPEVMDATMTAVRRKDAEEERVSKTHAGRATGRRIFSQSRRRGSDRKQEDQTGIETWKKTRTEEVPSKSGAQREEGDWEERRSEQTSHALVRA